MSINIITGYTGNQHITSADDGAMNAGIIGGENYVMETLEQFACEQLSANKIKIKSGDLVVNGRHARIRYGDYVEAVIENGSQTMKRNDLIVARYEKNTSTGVESFTISTIKGTPSTSPTDPLYITGNILTGDTVVEFPLYRVVLDGINIESVTKLFNVIPTMNDLKNEMSGLNTDMDTLNANLK
ncbi:MAG: hypothetical protein PHT76_11470, partial [Anaerostipes sp.]|nr:hypothetical protein [Anaerostipes sp.]